MANEQEQIQQPEIPEQPQLTPNQQPEQQTAQQPTKGFISRMGDGIKKGAKWAYDNREGIGNVVSNIGSRMQAGAYGGSGGKYGQAWGNTAAGMRQTHQQNLAAINAQAEANIKSGLGTAGGTTRDLQNDQFSHNTSERVATQDYNTMTRKEQEEFQEKQTLLQADIQDALAENNHERARELIRDQHMNTLEALGVQAKQAQELQTLMSKLDVEKQQNLWNAMMNYSSGQLDALTNFQRAMSGETDAELIAKIATMYANMGVAISGEFRQWIRGGSSPGTAPLGEKKTGRVHGGYYKELKNKNNNLSIDEKIKLLNKWNKNKSISKFDQGGFFNNAKERNKERAINNNNAAEKQQERINNLNEANKVEPLKIDPPINNKDKNKSNYTEEAKKVVTEINNNQKKPIENKKQ